MSSGKLTSYSHLKAFLHQAQITAKKGLSQNFLVDENILKKMLAEAALTNGDWVLEVGPGPGALTQKLLECGAQVIAVEQDRRLAQQLPRLDPSPALSVYEADFLTWPVADALAPRLKEGERAKLIANIPYQITSPILTKVLPMRHLFSSIIVMVQLEVAQRLTAPPGNKRYGSLTVFANFYSHPRLAFKVSRSSFYPKPSVDSAVVVFELRKPPLEGKEALFFEMVRCGFRKRRKMLTNSLSDLYPKDRVEKALQVIGLPSRVRPESLSLEQFLELFQVLGAPPRQIETEQENKR